MNDTIYRQEAIEAVEKESQVDGAYGYMDTKSIVDLLNDLPSAQPSATPTLYGYRIEHLALIATIMEKEGVTPEKAIEYFANADRMYQIIIQEEKELLNRALRWSEGQEA